MVLRLIVHPRIVLIALLIIVLAEKSHSGLLFAYRDGDPKDPENIDLVKDALGGVGKSLDGCKLTEFQKKRWIMGTSYKVQYTCKEVKHGEEKKGKCSFHFRHRFARLSDPEYPICDWWTVKTKVHVPKLTTTTTEEPTTEEPTAEGSGETTVKLLTGDCTIEGGEYVCS